MVVSRADWDAYAEHGRLPGETRDEQRERHEAEFKAMARVSATLSCGCRWAPGEPVEAVWALHAGCTVLCWDHGPVLLVRVTQHLEHAIEQWPKNTRRAKRPSGPSS